VFVNSNNAQTGRLELSNSVSSPFTGGTVTVAGRNNTSSSVRSVAGTNTLGGSIVLVGGGGSYRFEAASGGTFNLQASVAPAAALGGDRTISFAGSGVGSMTGAISLGGAGTLSVVKVGSGTWTMDAAHSYNGNTTVNGGTLIVKTAAQSPITSGTGANIQNGYLVMEHGADGGVFAANVLSILDAGYDQAPQFSTGTYRSSTADATKGLGWKDDGNSTTIGYAYYGDADLSGKVDSVDFNALIGNYGKTSGQIWAGGDFDYNGKVNTLDFNQLAGNFGLEIIAPVASPDALPQASLGSVVPEPTTLSLVAIGAGMMLRRRRA
jgi:autotransporter-associated beta strand protein